MPTGAQRFDFNNLLTFEMANNHQGSVSHGKRIIKEMAKIAKEFSLKASVKLQFRDLDTFIHPDYKDRTDVKHIPRFISTKLSEGEFKELIDTTKSSGLFTMVTPFDEKSVDLLVKFGVDVIKVASCSAHDWPLLEKIASAGKPVIVSVGGLNFKEIGRVVSFFEHRGADFAIMHCVAIYPTPSDKLHLEQIALMRDRYPHLTVGFSTHESPDNDFAIALAYAKGARIFEKHVGVPTDKIKLNAYSANPEQVRVWVKSYLEAVKSVGEGERAITDAEKDDLHSLIRGAYASKPIKKGDAITRDHVFFAMPFLGESQMKSGRFRDGFVADKNYKKGEPIDRGIEPKRPTKRDIIYTTVHEVKAMLNKARIPMSHDFTVEVSYHYGLDKFHETGCVIIDCINREYAKKLIVQLAGQFHPTHYHKLKDETFQILYGGMEADIEGRKKMLYPGDTLWLPRGVWHSFRTDTGVIIEEISTTARETTGDSYYVDKNIAAMPRDARKTRLNNWGRHQFDQE